MNTELDASVNCFVIWLPVERFCRLVQLDELRGNLAARPMPRCEKCILPAHDAL